MQLSFVKHGLPETSGVGVGAGHRHGANNHEGEEGE